MTKRSNNEKKIFSWMNPKLEISEINRFAAESTTERCGLKKIFVKRKLNSKGIITKESIKKGEMLFVMGGYILTIEEENELDGSLADKPLEISEYFSISPRKKADLQLMPQHYMNHSCDPNAGFKGQIFVVAMKSIKPGEEVTFDYAMSMHSNKKSNSYFSFDCECGSKKCRGKVTEDDWKNSELQSRYDGYFQYFLQEKINAKKTK
jgi:uncharacterized protein